jgi:FdhD protein
MAMPEMLAPRSIQAWSSGTFEDRPDALAVEEPLEIRVRNRPLAVTMRTPGHDEELAAGFLVTEGLVNTREDVVDIAVCERNEHGNAVNVRTAPLVNIDFERLARHTYMTSSCGVCGKASIEAVRLKARALGPGPTVSAAVLCSLPERMRAAQGAFAETGGLHAAAIVDAAGDLVVLREDIGRHNAVDKAVGRMFLDNHVPLSESILLVSGRASFEIMQKAAMAGIAVIAAVSAPSSLAVEFADQTGQTLIGFLRPPRFNVYSHPERVRES